MLGRKASALIAVCAAVLAASGCRPAIVSSDAGVYSTGTLYAVTSQDLTAAYEATLKACDQLELNVTESAKDVFYARVAAKGADGKRITVSLKPKEGGGTNLSIRVGTIGERYRSSALYEQIRQNLGPSGK